MPCGPREVYVSTMSVKSLLGIIDRCSLPDVVYGRFEFGIFVHFVPGGASGVVNTSPAMQST